MSKVTALVVLAILPVAALGQGEQCGLSGVFLPQDTQDGTYTVYPDVDCTDTGLGIQLVYTYGPGQIENSRIQLFHECTDKFGNVTADRVPESYDYPLDDYEYSVQLTSSFVEPGASCRVYGCYTANEQDSPLSIFPILNGTCQHTPETTALPSMATSIASTTPPEPSPSSTSIVNLSPLVTTTSNSFTSSSVSMVTTPTGTSDVITQAALLTTTVVTTVATAALVTPEDNREDQKIAIIVAIIIILVAAITIVTMLIAILLRARHVQRRKHFLTRYYNYSEPIDPYFSPVDIRARVSKAVSVLSVFDTLAPYYSPMDASDDDKSEVLQVANPVAENTSMKSMVFGDEGQVSSSECETDKTGQEEPKSGAEELTVADSNQDPPPSKSPLKNGYVPGNYSSTIVSAPPQALSPVSNGYILEKNYQPSVIPIQMVQSQTTIDSVPLQDKNQNNMKLTLNQTEQIHPQLPSSGSSGYVTELNTPSDYQNHPLNMKVGVTPEKPLPVPQQKYSKLKNGYSVVTQRRVVMETTPQEEDSHSVVYNLEEGVESVTSDCEGMESDSEGVQSVWERMYIENIVAECSLSLNPLHFEPVDDLVPDQEGPLYVNTTAEDQFFQPPSATY